MFNRYLTISLAFLLLTAAAVCSANPLSKYMSGGVPRTTSDFTCLMDGATGKVLYERNQYTHRPPASLTKMAAAIVLIENGSLSDTVTAPQAIVGTPESSLHLSPGETISLHDLLYAMLLRSANDTPIAGAYYLCGGIQPFVTLMNAKVDSIGCLNTNFVTPNGLYAPGHYSCAHDLALIARYGLNNVPFFRQVVKTREYRVTRSIHKGDSKVVNTALTFLTYFPGADGVKTGYISQAGHCFVGSATRGGWQLIAVALDSPLCRSDVVQMLSYGFAHFRQHVIYHKGDRIGSINLPGRTIPITTSADLTEVVVKGQAMAPLSAYTVRLSGLALAASESVSVGENVGQVSLFLKNEPVMSVDALAAQAFTAKPVETQARIGWFRTLLHPAVMLAMAFVLLPILYVFARILDLAIHARKIAKNSRSRRAHVTEDV